MAHAPRWFLMNWSEARSDRGCAGLPPAAAAIVAGWCVGRPVRLVPVLPERLARRSGTESDRSHSGLVARQRKGCGWRWPTRAAAEAVENIRDAPLQRADRSTGEQGSAVIESELAAAPFTAARAEGRRGLEAASPNLPWPVGRCRSRRTAWQQRWWCRRLGPLFIAGGDPSARRTCRSLPRRTRQRQGAPAPLKTFDAHYSNGSKKAKVGRPNSCLIYTPRLNAATFAATRVSRPQ
jgi:hypothetical protein